MTETLRSYVGGEWVSGEDPTSELVNPTTEEVVARTSTGGIDMAAALAYARDRGGPALREMTFAQRGAILATMSKTIHKKRDELLELSRINGGTTRSDGKFDIDGASGTLAYFGMLSGKLGDTHVWVDGESEQIGRSPRLAGRHVSFPRGGAAIHINAFNFPAWGFAEKAAVALLAGVPVVVKPATSTAMVTHRLVEILLEASLLPDGALTLLCGGPGDLLDHVEGRDVIAFTGSSSTGQAIRGHENVLARGARVNVEADSLNAAVLGPDITRDSDAYDLFLREVVKDITQKTGQKCTAIRRVFIPRDLVDQARGDLAEQLSAVKVGDPANKDVTMGPLATRAQLEAVTTELETLSAHTELAYGDGGRGDLIDVEGDEGFFMSPALLYAVDPDVAEAVHSREAFGPLATVMPYDGTATEATRLLAKGGGSLVSSVYTDDAEFARAMITGAAPHLGRLHLGSSKIAGHSPGPGTVLPMLVHGGPGRAGGGEELGGLRALSLYMQRTAVQGYRPWLDDLG